MISGLVDEGVWEGSNKMVTVTVRMMTVMLLLGARAELWCTCDFSLLSF